MPPDWHLQCGVGPFGVGAILDEEIQVIGKGGIIGIFYRRVDGVERWDGLIVAAGVRYIVRAIRPMAHFALIKINRLPVLYIAGESQGIPGPTRVTRPGDFLGR